MRILLIEDEDRSVRQATAAIDRSANSATVDVASSRVDAERMIQDKEYDLVICDLRIPPHSGSAEADESHGLAVHALARDLSPGTPLMFLTAYPVSGATRRQLSLGEVDSLLGLGKQPLVQLVEKDDIDGVEEIISMVFNAMEAIESGCSIEPASLDEPMFQRAVKIYAASTGHTRAVVQSTSGLSGAVVGRVKLQSDAVPPASIFLKVLPSEKARDEYGRYNQFVANRLPVGYFAPAMSPINAGLRKMSALISTLADDDCCSLFDSVRDAPQKAVDAVEKLRVVTAPWHENSAVVSTTVGELRRKRLPDSYLTGLPIDANILRQIEETPVSFEQVVVHGDLHGENILLGSSSRPMLIDFGDSGLGYSPVDPITLELSLFFNKKGPGRDAEYEAGIDWSSWLDVDTCYGDSPLAEFAAACRAWAYQVADAQSIIAFGYAHSIRQLKYGDVNHTIALSIADACIKQLTS